MAPPSRRFVVPADTARGRRADGDHGADLHPRYTGPGMRRPASAEIPDVPGAYLFRDLHGQVLYVGKANSLRKRVANYFGTDLQARTQAMVDAADSIEWIVTESEVAGFMFACFMIKKHPPRFNFRLRGD